MANNHQRIQDLPIKTIVIENLHEVIQSGEESIETAIKLSLYCTKT